VRVRAIMMPRKEIYVIDSLEPVYNLLSCYYCQFLRKHAKSHIPKRHNTRTV